MRWLSEPPKNCDLCEDGIKTVFIDGRTNLGPWGFMCPSCHLLQGCGLGTGKGQKYELINGVWIKTEG